MVLYHGRVKNKFAPSLKQSAGVKRTIFTNNTPLNYNSYIVGGNVGGLNSSVRRALVKRASHNCCSSTSSQ